MTEQLPIIIAGAGPGGLSAALALSQKGLPVLLLERNVIPTEVGAGIQISPNATSSLKQWGVWPHLEKLVVSPDKIKIHSGITGSLLTELPTQDYTTRYGSPYMVVHRADLQQALYHRASQSGLIEMLDEREVREITENETSIEVRCKLANGENRFYRGAALIAADGVWSRIRTDFLNNSPAAYSGKTAWRTTLPKQMVPASFDSENVGLWLAPKAHLVHYPIVGGQMMNIVAIVDEDWSEEGWNTKGDAAWINARFARWPREIRELLSERDDWLKWALCGHDPSQNWVRGRVALLGDAAHAMLPFMAQGAVMSIEDAAILARALTEIDASMETRLLAYEKARKKRVSRVVARARQNGRIYHMDGPLAAARNLTMRLLPQGQLVGQFDWIYGWKPEDVHF
ncbi:FAD-dependent monooxygenase [uncultured Cohaesibacter sp.]|uniref:FAD-dependent monooxygenase n=1 Tax=uncultured Cohaesibacter sp. TaxID=1002546 RepID=UPI00292F8C2C|nr:FAD-dependent monooxygenase [uncultured Cohaesibacter sp.]